MIICDCGKRHTSTTQFDNVKQLGLALMGTCTKCGLRQGVDTLWRRTKTIKWTGNVEKERKSKMSKKLVPIL